MRSENITVFDVAKRANLSIATVSRALSGKPSVAYDTRQRVLAIADELGYTPNVSAQSLRTGKRSSVAFVTGDMRHGASSNLAGKVQLELEKAGLDTMLYDIQHSQDRLHHLLEKATASGLYGIILATADALDMNSLQPYAKEAIDQGIKILSVTQQLSTYGITSIVHDNKQGAKAAVTHLLKRGCKNIAFLGRISTSATGRERYEGYVEALHSSGKQVDNSLVWESISGYRSDAGYETLQAVLNKKIQFDGIMAATDELAIGAIAAMKDRGILVPTDILIIGYGGAGWGKYVSPSISTVLLNNNEISLRISEFFNSNLAEANSKLTLIPTELIIRETA